MPDRGTTLYSAPPGRTIVYERVKDYWGKDLPVNIGFNNFDVIRIDFYRDRTPAFEAFKKGEVNLLVCTDVAAGGLVADVEHA